MDCQDKLIFMKFKFLVQHLSFLAILSTTFAHSAYGAQEMLSSSIAPDRKESVVKSLGLATFGFGPAIRNMSPEENRSEAYHFLIRYDREVDDNYSLASESNILLIRRRCLGECWSWLQGLYGWSKGLGSLAQPLD